MRNQLLVAAFTLLLAPAVQAQNFLMNSAETINQGNFKISGFPTALLGEDDADNEWGVATRLGYGFTRSLDVEAKAAFFDGLKLIGADAEYWVVKGKTDLSLAAGLHKADFEGEGADSTAIDFAAIASRKVASRLEAYLGGSLSRESVDDVEDSSFTRFYIVPGVEYRLAKDVDLLAEVGLGVNDDSPNYLSFGVSYYVR